MRRMGMVVVMLAVAGSCYGQAWRPRYVQVKGTVAPGEQAVFADSTGTFVQSGSGTNAQVVYTALLSRMTALESALATATGRVAVLEATAYSGARPPTNLAAVVLVQTGTNLEFVAQGRGTSNLVTVASGADAGTGARLRLGGLDNPVELGGAVIEAVGAQGHIKLVTAAGIGMELASDGTLTLAPATMLSFSNLVHAAMGQ